MASGNQLTLRGGESITILYEDRSVLAVDKPAGWIMAPSAWRNTSRNLQSAIERSIADRDFWARSRNLRFLRYVHRLDAETTGVLLMAKSPGAVKAYSVLFENRAMEKQYVAVVSGVPKQTQWRCTLPIGQDPLTRSKMRVDRRSGKDAETEFRVLAISAGTALVSAMPLTGRTHQIRVHLQAAGCPILGDPLYGTQQSRHDELGLRAVALRYRDPFTGRRVVIEAPVEKFARRWGFEPPHEGHIGPER